MTFIQNKYTRWYNSIIDRAKLRTPDSYTELHHIIPESFFINRKRKGARGWVLGDPNDPTNIVKLTAREHFVCHLLLPKMVSGPGQYKMLRALMGMSVLRGPGQERISITSRRYSQLVEQLSNVKMPEDIKKNYVKAAKIREEKRRRKGLSGTFKGKKHTEETRIKMRIPKTEEQKLHHSRIMKGKNLGRRSPKTGKTYEELFGIERALEIKEKIKQIGEKNGFFGKQHSSEQREKKRQEKLAAPKIKCYYCSKEIDHMNYARWHGNKCRQLIGPIKTGQRLKKECLHCGKFAGPGLFERYHNDNCKSKT